MVSFIVMSVALTAPETSQFHFHKSCHQGCGLFSRICSPYGPLFQCRLFHRCRLKRSIWAGPGCCGNPYDSMAFAPPVGPIGTYPANQFGYNVPAYPQGMTSPTPIPGLPVYTPEQLQQGFNQPGNMPQPYPGYPPQGQPAAPNEAEPQNDNRTTAPMIPPSLGYQPSRLTPASLVDPNPELEGVPAPARLMLHVPENAKLYVDGQLIPGDGGKRKFHTPDLKRGKTYYYLFRMEIDGAAQEKVVSVCAGDMLVERFE